MKPTFFLFLFSLTCYIFFFICMNRCPPFEVRPLFFSHMCVGWQYSVWEGNFPFGRWWWWPCMLCGGLLFFFFLLPPLGIVQKVLFFIFFFILPPPPTVIDWVPTNWGTSYLIHGRLRTNVKRTCQHTSKCKKKLFSTPTFAHICIKSFYSYF